MSSAWTGLSLVTRGIMYYRFCDHKNIQNCASTEIFSSTFLEFCVLSILAVVFAIDTFLQHLPTGSLCYCSRNSCIRISTRCAQAQPALSGSGRLLHPLTTGGTAIELPLLASLWDSRKHLRDFFLGCQGILGNLQSSSFKHSESPPEGTWTLPDMPSSHMHTVAS